MLVEVLAVEAFLDEVSALPGGDGEQTRNRAHRRGDDHEPKLARPDLAAQCDHGGVQQPHDPVSRPPTPTSGAPHPFPRADRRAFARDC